MIQQRTREQALLEISRYTAMHGVSNYSVNLTPRNKKRNSVASCNYLFKAFNFVEFYATHLSDKDFKEVILHEIAHALAPFHKHDPFFKNVCRRIGGNPNATGNYSYLNDAIPVHLKKRATYTYVCIKCGKEVPAGRKWTRIKSCSDCSNRFDMSSRFVLKEELQSFLATYKQSA